MINHDLFKKIFFRYPKLNTNIFINPEACNMPKGFLIDINSDFNEVNDINKADYILIHLDYKNPCNYYSEKYLEDYPDKCLHVTNFIEMFHMDLPEIDKETYLKISEFIKSSDYESIYLGLNMLKQYKLDSFTRGLILPIIDTYSNRDGYMTINKYRTEESITIDNNDLIKYYNLLIHNEFIK